jgi:transposase-like protein
MTETLDGVAARKKDKPALSQKMTEHLGHEKHGPAGNKAGNVRNGTWAKTVLTEPSGQVGIEVPRDRAGTFEPQIVRKRQRAGVSSLAVATSRRVNMPASCAVPSNGRSAASQSALPAT